MRPSTRAARKPKKESRRKKQDAILRLEREDERAALRYEWAVTVRAAQGGYGTRRKQLIAKIEAGQVRCPPLEPGETAGDVVWSREHIRRIIALPPERVSIEALREKAGKGRPKKELDERLMDEFRKELELQRYASEKDLWRHLCAFADNLGVERPSAAKIYALLKEEPYIALVAAKHGTMAARADATPGSTVAAYWPHHIWALDELTVPVWIRLWLNRAVGWIAVRVDACIVIDVYSQVILGWYIGNPLRRGALRGLDRFDVFGAACSALFPDLADPRLVDYVGHIPHVLRFDKAKAHDLAGIRFRMLGVEVPKLPGYQPWLRAEVEAVVGIVKSMCCRLDGYDEKWGVAEYEAEIASKRRKLAVAQGQRLPTHVHATVEQLMTLEQLRRAFGDVVDRYNQREHDAWGTTREARYFNALPDAEVRPWTDAMVALQPKRVEVGKASLRYRGQTFAPKVGARMLEVGEHVTFRPDPLLRGVFVQDAGMIEFLPLKSEWAKDVSGVDVAREQNAIAGHYSRLARDARAAYQADRLGDSGAALANAVAARTLDGSDVVRAAARPMLDAQKRAVKDALAGSSDPTADPTELVNDTVMPVGDVPTEDTYEWMGHGEPDAPVEENSSAERGVKAPPRPGRSRKRSTPTVAPNMGEAARPAPRAPAATPAILPPQPVAAAAGGAPRRRGILSSPGSLLRLLK